MKMTPNLQAAALILVSIFVGVICLLAGDTNQATMWFTTVMLMNFLNVRLP